MASWQGVKNKPICFIPTSTCKLFNYDVTAAKAMYNRMIQRMNCEGWENDKHLKDPHAQREHTSSINFMV